MVMAIVIIVFHVCPVYRIPDRSIDRYNSPTGSGALSRLKENDSAGITTARDLKSPGDAPEPSGSVLCSAGTEAGDAGVTISDVNL
jgi:hypothetical protein